MSIRLKRGTVKLAPYNPEWGSHFENEKKTLEKTFGDTIMAVEHIGSTAVLGILAKPIIDINVGVKSLEVARNMKEKFGSLGYEHRPFVSGMTKEDLKWQELYVKGPETKRTYHVHVTVFGNSYWSNDLLFRDFLRNNPVRVRECSEFKKGLAGKHVDDRQKYTKAKEKFIKQVISDARIGKNYNHERAWRIE